MTAQASYVCELHREFLRQFAGNREIEGIGIRSLHRLVNTPGNGLTSIGGRLWELAGRRIEENLDSVLRVLGDRVDVGYTRHAVRGIVWSARSSRVFQITAGVLHS